MTSLKRHASSTAHLIGTELSDDGLAFPSSPTVKRSRRKKSNKVGDGWLFRPSGPRIPSPNTSPLPIRWKKLSSPRFIPNTEKAMEVNHEPGPGRSANSCSGEHEIYSDDEDVHDQSMTATLKNDSDSGKDSLKTVTKRLHALDKKMSMSPQIYRQELAGLRENIRNLEERIQRNEIRAAIRHDIIFDALKKISEDVNQIRSSSNQTSTLKSDDEGTKADQTTLNGLTSSSIKKKRPRGRPRKRSRSGSAGADKKDPLLTTATIAGTAANKISKSPLHQKNQSSAARKTMERCLDQYMDKMNNATTVDEVKKTGNLCKQYAEDLIKTYI